MNWYEYLLLTPIRAANGIRSNVWSVLLIIGGITLVLHGHENVGSSLVTGAFAVFRSSKDDTPDVTQVSTPTIPVIAQTPHTTTTVTT